MMNLLELQKQIPTTCKILAVSKGQPFEKILILHQLGQKLFAENYVQEALEKIEKINQQHKSNSIQWHFIGRIQKNKLKDIVGNFALIHSVDSLAIAQAVQKQADKKAVMQNILLQVNIAGEESKAGCSIDSLPEILEQIGKMQSIRLCGFMTMPPLSRNPEASRTHFQQLKKLLLKYQKTNSALKELSMGTTSDYLVAAQEGASFIRVGTLLFGERQK